MPNTKTVANNVALSESSNKVKKKNPKSTQQRGIQSVEIGFSILDVLLRAGRALPLNKIAEGTGLTVANVHYYLVSFQRVGVVLQEPDTGHYGLGSYALKLGVSALEQFDVYKLARSAMADLSEHTGHTVFLGVWGNKGPTIVNRVEGGASRPLLELRVGSVLPLLSSALGRNFVAHLPSNVTTPLIELELTLNCPVANPSEADVPQDMPAVQAMIERIQAQGYSHCRNTLLPHFTSMSAPIMDLSGSIVAALTIMGPNHLMERSEADTLQRLRHHAAEISQTAGVYG